MNRYAFAYIVVCMMLASAVLSAPLGSGEIIALKGDWPMFNYDSRHVGFNKTYQNVPKTNFTIWKTAKLDGPFDLIQPVVWNGTIFVGTSAMGGTGGMTKGAFYAINEQNGSVKWRFLETTAVLSSAVIHATPTEEYVIFGADNSLVYALNASNGKLVWKFDSAGAGAKIDAHLTYNAKTKCVYFTTITYSARTPTIGNYTLRCYALQGKNGAFNNDWSSANPSKPYWEYTYEYEDIIPGKHQCSTPAVDFEAGLVFVAAAYAEEINNVWRKWGKLFAIDLLNGQTKWVADVDATPNAGPVVGTDYVYVGTSNGTVYAFPKIEPEPKNGIMEFSNLYWLYQARDWGMEPMPITNGMVLAKLTKPANKEVLIFGCGGPKNEANGRLYALDAHGTRDPDDGFGFKASTANGLSSDYNISAEIVWFYQWDEDPNLRRSTGFEKGPCAAGGMVYIAGQTQQLYGFQLNGRYDKLDGPLAVNPQGIDLMYDLIWYYQGNAKDDGRFGIPCVVNNKLIIGDSKNCIRAIGNAPPRPSFTAFPNPGKTNKPVSFNANASKDPNGDPMWFNWSWGDASNGDSFFKTAFASHIYITKGTYKIVLTVDDGEYKNSSKPLNLVIESPKPPPEPPIWAQLWFWALIIVAIAAVVILLLFLTRKKPGPQGYGGTQQGYGPGYGQGPAQPYGYKPPGR